MKFSLPHRFNALRNLKNLVILVVCAMVLFLNSSPAFAFGTKSSSNPSAGAAQLDETLQEAREAINGQPRGMDKIQSKARQGINEVQGDADIDKMNRPENSQDATTVKGDIERALDSVTDN